MKLLIPLLFLSMNASAASQALFVGVGNEVRIFIQSTKAGDKDARRFFDFINVPATTDGAKEKKTAKFTEGDGTVTDFICSITPRMASVGSCQMIVRASAIAKVDKANKFIDYRLTNPTEIAEFLKILALPMGPNPVFITTDGRFSIVVESDPSGPKAISVQYQE